MTLRDHVVALVVPISLALVLSLPLFDRLQGLSIDLLFLLRNSLVPSAVEPQAPAVAVITIDLIGSYCFWHESYPGDSANVKLGLLYRDEGRATWNGATVADSGSEVLFGRFGLTWHPTPAWDINFTFDMPISEDYNGTQLGTDYQLALAVGLRF